MRLVVDTNVLIAALLRDSTSRRILTSPTHTFILPEHGRQEIERHMDELIPRMGMPKEEAELLLALVMEGVETIPASEIQVHMAEAWQIMRDLDPDDAAFVALALAVPCDGIWTQDKALHRQTRIPTFTTAEIADEDSGE